MADADTWPGFAQMLLDDHAARLTDWECDFCESWAVKPEHYTPSDKQRAVFQKGSSD
jgi:hypothetical protein